MSNLTVTLYTRSIPVYKPGKIGNRVGLTFHCRIGESL